MTTVQTPGLFRHLWKAVLGWGVISVVLGVAILLWPGISIEIAAVLFGVYLLVSASRRSSSDSLSTYPAANGCVFLSSGFSLALGVLALRHLGEGYAILLLAIWLGVGFIPRVWPGPLWRSAFASCPAADGTSSSESSASLREWSCWRGHSIRSSSSPS